MTYGLLLCLGSACAPRFSLSGSLSFPHSPFPFEPRRGGCKVRRWALFVRVPSLPLKGFSCGQAQPECLCARKSLRLVIIAASSHVGLICPLPPNVFIIAEPARAFVGSTAREEHHHHHHHHRECLFTSTPFAVLSPEMQSDGKSAPSFAPPLPFEFGPHFGGGLPHGLGSAWCLSNLPPGSLIMIGHGLCSLVSHASPTPSSYP